MIAKENNAKRVRKRYRKSYHRSKQLSPSPPRSSSTPNSDGSTLTVARFRKETNKLDAALKTLQPLARVTNGITLEIGLLSGEFESEDVVTELLHVGDLTIKDITDLKQDVIDKVLGTLGQEPAADSAVTTLENQLVTLENLRKIAPKLENLEDVPGQKEYMEKLDKVKGLKTLESDLTSLQSELSTLTGSLKSLKEFSEKPSDKLVADEVLHKLSIPFFGIGKLESSSTLLETLSKSVSEAKKIQGKSSFMNILFSENELRNPFVMNRPKYAAFQTLQDHFAKMYNKSNSVIPARENFKTIQTLFDSRGPLHRQSFKLSSGFPSGSSDLGRLSLDSADETIGKYGEVVAKNLRKAFEPLKTLEIALDVVPDKWKLLSDHYDEVKSVLDTVVKLVSLSNKAESISYTVQELKKCDEAVDAYPSSDVKELEKIQKSMNDLSRKVEEISDFGYISKFKDLGNLKPYFNTVNLTTEEQKSKLIAATLGKWNADESLRAFVRNVDQLQKDITFLLELLKDPTQGVDLTILSEHVKIFNKQIYVRFLTCMRSITTVGYPVKDLIDYIQKSTQFSVSHEVKSAISSIIQSQNSLKSAQNAAEELKNNPDLSLEAQALKTAFEKADYKEVSRKLGMGVQGLLAIHKAQTANIGDLVGKAKEIQEDAKKQGLSDEQLTSLEQLKEVQNVMDLIGSSLNLTKRKRATGGIQEFRQLFKDAQNIQGMKIDMRALRDAMETLNKATQNKYIQALTQLDVLETLDLDFARFRMKDAAGSLVAMDQFFMFYAKHSIPASFGSSIPSRPHSMSFETTVAMEVTTVADWLHHPATIPSSLGGGFFLTLLSIYLCYRFGCCSKKPPPDIDLPPVDDSSIENGKSKDSSTVAEKVSGTPVSSVPSTSTAQPTNTPVADQAHSLPDAQDQKGGDVANVKNQNGSETGQADPRREVENRESNPTQPVSDDDALSLVKNCVVVIRRKARQGKTPSFWACEVVETIFKNARLMLQDADLKGEDERM